MSFYDDLVKNKVIKGISAMIPATELIGDAADFVRDPSIGGAADLLNPMHRIPGAQAATNTIVKPFVNTVADTIQDRSFDLPSRRDVTGQVMDIAKGASHFVGASADWYHDVGQAVGGFQRDDKLGSSAMVIGSILSGIGVPIEGVKRNMGDAMFAESKTGEKTPFGFFMDNMMIDVLGKAIGKRATFRVDELSAGERMNMEYAYQQGGGDAVWEFMVGRKSRVDRAIIETVYDPLNLTAGAGTASKAAKGSALLDKLGPLKKGVTLPLDLLSGVESAQNAAIALPFRGVGYIDRRLGGHGTELLRKGVNAAGRSVPATWVSKAFRPSKTQLIQGQHDTSEYLYNKMMDAQDFFGDQERAKIMAERDRLAGSIDEADLEGAAIEEWIRKEFQPWASKVGALNEGDKIPPFPAFPRTEYSEVDMDWYEALREKVLGIDRARPVREPSKEVEETYANAQDILRWFDDNARLDRDGDPFAAFADEEPGLSRPQYDFEPADPDPFLQDAFRNADERAFRFDAARGTDGIERLDDIDLAVGYELIKDPASKQGYLDEINKRAKADGEDPIFVGAYGYENVNGSVVFKGRPVKRSADAGNTGIGSERLDGRPEEVAVPGGLVASGDGVGRSAAEQAGLVGSGDSGLPEPESLDGLDDLREQLNPSTVKGADPEGDSLVPGSDLAPEDVRGGAGAPENLARYPFGNLDSEDLAALLARRTNKSVTNRVSKEIARRRTESLDDMVAEMAELADRQATGDARYGQYRFENRIRELSGKVQAIQRGERTVYRPDLGSGELRNRARGAAGAERKKLFAELYRRADMDVEDSIAALEALRKVDSPKTKVYRRELQDFIERKATRKRGLEAIETKGMDDINVDADSGVQSNYNNVNEAFAKRDERELPKNDLELDRLDEENTAYLLERQAQEKLIAATPEEKAAPAKILDALDAMTDRQIAALRAYVESGGKGRATGFPSSIKGDADALIKQYPGMSLDDAITQDPVPTAVSSEVITPNTPDPEPGMTRLYRVEQRRPEGFRKSSEKSWDELSWVEQGARTKGKENAFDRWFAADPAEVDWYVNHFANGMQMGKDGIRITYIDVPVEDADKYLVANLPDEIIEKARIGDNDVPVRVTPKKESRFPESEYFVPRELADARQEFVGDIPRPSAVRDLGATDAAQAALPMELPPSMTLSSTWKKMSPAKQNNARGYFRKYVEWIMDGKIGPEPKAPTFRTSTNRPGQRDMLKTIQELAEQRGIELIQQVPGSEDETAFGTIKLMQKLIEGRDSTVAHQARIDKLLNEWYDKADEFVRTEGGGSLLPSDIIAGVPFPGGVTRDMVDFDWLNRRGTYEVPRFVPKDGFDRMGAAMALAKIQGAAAPDTSFMGRSAGSSDYPGWSTAAVLNGFEQRDLMAFDYPLESALVYEGMRDSTAEWFEPLFNSVEPIDQAILQGLWNAQAREGFATLGIDVGRKWRRYSRDGVEWGRNTPAGRMQEIILAKNLDDVAADIEWLHKTHYINMAQEAPKSRPQYIAWERYKAMIETRDRLTRMVPLGPRIAPDPAFQYDYLVRLDPDEGPIKWKALDRDGNEIGGFETKTEALEAADAARGAEPMGVDMLAQALNNAQGLPVEVGGEAKLGYGSGTIAEQLKKGNKKPVRIEIVRQINEAILGKKHKPDMFVKSLDKTVAGSDSIGAVNLLAPSAVKLGERYAQRMGADDFVAEMYEWSLIDDEELRLMMTEVTDVGWREDDAFQVMADENLVEIAPGEIVTQELSDIAPKTAATIAAAGGSTTSSYNRSGMSVAQAILLAQSWSSNPQQAKNIAMAMLSPLSMRERSRAYTIWTRYSNMVREALLMNVARGVSALFTDQISSAYMRALEGDSTAANGLNLRNVWATSRYMMGDIKALPDELEYKWMQRGRNLRPEIINTGSRDMMWGDEPTAWVQTIRDTSDAIVKAKAKITKQPTGVLPSQMRQKPRLMRMAEILSRTVSTRNIKAMRHAGDVVNRKGAFDYASSRALPTELKQFWELAEKRAANMGPLPKNKNGYWYPTSRINDWKRQLQGDTFSPQDVKRITGDTALSQAWLAGLKRAEQAGVDFTEKVLFSYKLTKTDEIMRQTFLFHYWQSRAIAWHANKTVRNPWLLSTYVKAWEGLNELSEDQGIEQKNQGFIGFLVQNSYAALLDPMALLVPFAIFREWGDDYGQDGGFVDDLLKTSNLFLNPMIQAAFTAVGLSGKATDVTGTKTFRNLAISMINRMRNAGIIPGIEGFTGDPVTKVQDHILKFSNENVGIFGNDMPELNWTASANNDIYEVIMHQAELEFGLWEQMTPDQQKEVMAAQVAVLNEDWSNHRFRRAANAYINETMYQNMGRAVIPGNLQLLYTPEARRDAEATRGYDAFRAGGTPTPEQSSAMSSAEQMNAGSEASIYMIGEEAGYNAIGTDQARADNSIYYGIMYGDLVGGTSVTIGGIPYGAEEINGLDPASRRRVLELWTNDSPGRKAGIEKLKLDRDIFTGDSVMYGKYKEYKGWIGDMGNDQAARLGLRKMYPEYARLEEVERQKLNEQGNDVEAGLDQFVYSTEAFLAVLGVKKNLRSPTPLAVTSGSPSLWLGTPGTVSEGFTGAPEPEGTQLERDIADYIQSGRSYTPSAQVTRYLNWAAKMQRLAPQKSTSVAAYMETQTKMGALTG